MNSTAGRPELGNYTTNAQIRAFGQGQVEVVTLLRRTPGSALQPGMAWDMAVEAEEILNGSRPAPSGRRLGVNQRAFWAGRLSAALAWL